MKSKDSRAFLGCEDISLPCRFLASCVKQFGQSYKNCSSYFYKSPGTVAVPGDSFFSFHFKCLSPILLSPSCQSLSISLSMCIMNITNLCAFKPKSLFVFPSNCFTDAKVLQLPHSRRLEIPKRIGGNPYRPHTCHAACRRVFRPLWKTSWKSYGNVRITLWKGRGKAVGQTASYPYPPRCSLSP